MRKISRMVIMVIIDNAYIGPNNRSISDPYSFLTDNISISIDEAVTNFQQARACAYITVVHKNHLSHNKSTGSGSQF